MNTIIFKTSNAVFKFNQKDVEAHLTPPATNNNIDEAAALLKLVKTTSGKFILSPDNHQYFEYVALDLIVSGKGSVTCRACEKIHPANQLNPITIGQGKSPFAINVKTKGGIKRPHKKNPSMFGGKGYQCPEGHTLISVETWRT